MISREVHQAGCPGRTARRRALRMHRRRVRSWRTYARPAVVLLGCIPLSWAGGACTSNASLGATGRAVNPSPSVSPPSIVDSSARPAPPPDGSGEPGQAPTVAPYLRRLADVLAAPGPTPTAVLAAAGAREVRRRPDRVYFSPSEPRLAEGTLYFAPASSLSAVARHLEFDCAPPGGSVTLREIGAAFGRAVPGPQSTSLAPVWLLVFPVVYRPPGPDRPGAGAVRISAEISTENLSKDDLLRGPIPPSARVVRVVLQRERAGPEQETGPD